MKEERIKKLLAAMGADRIKEDETDVHSSCPLAPWTHEKGIDRHPSFGVLINDRGPSKYNCFACKAGGQDLKALVWRWMELSGNSVPRGMEEWLQEVEVPDLVEGGQDAVYDLYPEMMREEILPEAWWGPFAGGVPKYALDRGLTLDTCRKWGLGHDKEHHRLMFSVRNERGELVSIIGRKTHQEVPGPKYITFTGTKKGRYLYGENMRLSGDRIIVVEGTMDVLHVWQHGFRDVVGALGSVLTKDQSRTLIKWDLPVYLFMDNDLAGIQGMIGAVGLLAGKVPVWVALYGDGKREPTDFSQKELEVALRDAVDGKFWAQEAMKMVKVLKEEKRKKRVRGFLGEDENGTGEAVGND